MLIDFIPKDFIEFGWEAVTSSALLFDSIDFKLSKHSEAVRKPSHRFCCCSFRIRVFPSGKNIFSSVVSGCVLAEE